MRLKGNITAVQTTGDGVKLSIQGKIGRAKWKSIETQFIIVDDTRANRRAFYLGRDVSIVVKPL